MKILFVGEHIHSKTGNGNMMNAVLSKVDREKYQIACLCARDVDPIEIAYNPVPFTIIPAMSQADFWGSDKLLNLTQRMDINVLCFVGIDIWQYAQVWPQLMQIRDAKKFKIVYIFPYDLQYTRMDWVKWISDCDVPCVYSQYGYNMLKDYVPHIRQFRPPLYQADLFKPLPDRHKIRREMFPSVPSDSVVFGFVGVNQIRKQPERLIKAFMDAKKTVPNIVLYLHTEMEGFHNLKQFCKDCGAKEGDILMKRQGPKYTVEQMVKVYNAIDCLVNCSMQEGLSWTLVEAMACGTPVIASDTTAQTELAIGVGELVPCNDMAFVPMVTESGQSQVEGKACRVRDIRDALIKVALDAELRAFMAEDGLARAKEWLAGVDNINDVLAEAVKPKKPEVKIPKVLFAQHSSAGDVLMTTQCFKGIKERHKGMPLVYMTQPVYQDVVAENPYVDEIIDWDERELKRYEVVYNPHGEHILPGGFNNLDVTLYSMYPYFCKVESDEMFIELKAPSVAIMERMPGGDEIGDGYIVVHTTGGSKMYRSYPHMDLALKGIGFPIVQVGGASDIRCKSDLDLCGKLTFRETAWVMKNAKAAVVIDSFLSHLAGAVGTNAVVLYGPAPARVVGPKAQHGTRIINLQPDMLAVCKIMSHCWGTNPQCTSPCIHTISPNRVKKALKELL